jgi:DHA2 family multidrug resistance protein-like MFS transporter
MASVKLPDFIDEVVSNRASLKALGAAALALAAAGMNPQITSPFVVDVQSAIRAQPNLAAFTTFVGVISAGTLLAGGVTADAFRRRRILTASLVVIAGASAVSLAVPSGPIFLGSRVLGALATGFAIPFAIAAVATLYTGPARAAAIGVAYAGYGAGLFLPPILLTITGPGGSDAPAYLASTAVGIGAIVASRRIPDLPGASAADAAVAARVAIWAFGIIFLAAGLAVVGSGTNPIRLAMIALGIAILGLAGLLQWRSRARPVPIDVDVRTVAIVLGAGLFVGLAQSVPMALLPVFFEVILGYGPIFAVAAIAPIIVALVLAGPVAGWLLPRSSPRVLIGGGLIGVGLGDLLLGFVAGRGVSYLLFIMPFVLVGAGFVIATTVRTAVIFASVPRHLPGSAAALNEASVGLGGRIGIAAASLVLTQATINAYTATLPAGVDLAQAAQPLHDLLIALGTPNFAAAVSGADASLLPAYADAYVEGIRVVHLIAGVIAIVAGLVAGLLLRRQDPLEGVWEHAR